MKRSRTLFTCLSIILIFASCEISNRKSGGNSEFIGSETENKSTDLLEDVNPLHSGGYVNAVIEIPAGTLEKWELNKSTGKVELEKIDNKPREINYLGYPGNYGFIPGTLVSKEKGGDGDPLDIIVLGPPLERSEIVKCKLIGILYLVDRGEQDDKLISVSTESPLYRIDSLDELKEEYNGISEILHLWFTNYKGPGKMESKGFGDKKSAIHMLESAIKEYQSDKARHNIL